MVFLKILTFDIILEVLQFFVFFGFICYLHNIGKEKNDFYYFPVEKNLKKILYNVFFFCLILGDSFTTIMVCLFVFINCFILGEIRYYIDK
jgi:hypothetical protein